MRSVDEIMNDLQKTALSTNQGILVKELYNTLGGMQKQLRDEILAQVDIAAGGKDVLPVDEIRNIIMLSGEEL